MLRAAVSRPAAEEVVRKNSRGSVVTPRATLGACLAAVAVGWNSGSIAGIATSFASAYRTSLATVGLMTTVLAVTHTILNLPAGKASDRFGPRRMIAAGLVVIALGNALAAIRNDVALAMTMRGLVGFGTAFSFVAASDYVRAQGGSRLAQGVIGGFGLGGVGIAVAVVAQLEEVVGWRVSFVSGFVMAAVALAVFALTARDDAPRPQAALRESSHEAVARLAEPRARLFRLTLLQMASVGFALIVGTWVVTLLEKAGGYNQGVAGLVGGLVLASGIVGRPVGGWLAGHRPQHARALLAVSLLVAGSGTAFIATAPGPAPAVVASLLVGLAAGIPYASVVHGAALARPHAPGAAIGQTNMFGNGVAAAGIPILGLAFSWEHGGQIGFLVIAVLWAATVLAVPSNRELGLEHARQTVDDVEPRAEIERL
jgi:MFS family permease